MAGASLLTVINATLMITLSFHDVAASGADPIPKVSFIDNEPEFRWELLQEQVAFDKLHEGIKKFAEDGAKLKEALRAKLAA